MLLLSFYSPLIYNIKLKYGPCDFIATRPCEWFIHIKSRKHSRNGQAKLCEICNVEFKTHWIQKMHKLKFYASIEERSKMKYYCKECDLVFFSQLYIDKHTNGKIHSSQGNVYALKG